MRLGSAVVLAAAACSVQVDFSDTAYRCGPDRACPNGFICLEGQCLSQFPIYDGAADGPVIDAPPGGADADPGPPWWDAAYRNRARLTVRNASAQTMVDGYQVGFAIPDVVLSASLDNRDDVRIVDWDGTAWTEEVRVHDTYSTSEPWMWFGIPVDLPAAQSLDRTWIYFSNAAAAAPSGGPSSVMEFYDSFGGTTLNTTRWTALGTVTTAGDELVLDPGESVRSNTTWPPGHAVDFSMEVPVWSARFWGGFQRSADFNDDEPWLIWISRSGSMIWPEVETSAGGVDPAVLGPMSPVGTAKVIYGIERHAGEVVFRKGQVEVGSIPIPNAFDAALQVRLTNQSSGAIQFGQARVRRVVRPAPEVTVGPVQNYP